MATFRLLDWVGVDLNIRCPLCKEVFKNEVECPLIGGKWPVVGRCGHSICRKCWQLKFEGASAIFLPCPLKVCSFREAFHGREIAPNRAMMEALDRWEDIDALVKQKLTEYESLNKTKLIKQRTRFSDERNDLVQKITELLQRDPENREEDTVDNKRKSPLEEADFVAKSRRVSLDWPDNSGTKVTSNRGATAVAKAVDATTAAAKAADTKNALVAAAKSEIKNPYTKRRAQRPTEYWLN